MDTSLCAIRPHLRSLLSQSFALERFSWGGRRKRRPNIHFKSGAVRSKDHSRTPGSGRPIGARRSQCERPRRHNTGDKGRKGYEGTTLSAARASPGYARRPPRGRGPHGRQGPQRQAWRSRALLGSLDLNHRICLAPGSNSCGLWRRYFDCGLWTDAPTNTPELLEKDSGGIFSIIVTRRPPIPTN